MDQYLNHLPAHRKEPQHFGKSGPRKAASRGPVPTYFQRPCPTCGRRLLIRVEYLGQEVCCSHCRCALVARDVSQDPCHEAELGGSILRRAEQLLALLESSGGNHGMCNV
jgi:hypothetical protein